MSLEMIETFLAFDEIGLKIYAENQAALSLGLWFSLRIGRLQFTDHRA